MTARFYGVICLASGDERKSGDPWVAEKPFFLSQATSPPGDESGDLVLVPGRMCLFLSKSRAQCLEPSRLALFTDKVFSSSESATDISPACAFHRSVLRRSLGSTNKEQFFFPRQHTSQTQYKPGYTEGVLQSADIGHLSGAPKGRSSGNRALHHALEGDLGSQAPIR